MELQGCRGKRQDNQNKIGMALLKKPRQKISDHDFVQSFLLDDEYIETKEEWDMMRNALYAALEWGKKVK